MLAAAFWASTWRMNGNERCSSKYHSSSASSFSEKGSRMVIGYSPSPSKLTAAQKPSSFLTRSRIVIKVMDFSEVARMLLVVDDHDQYVLSIRSFDLFDLYV